MKKYEKQIRFVIQQKGIVDKLDRKIREFLLQYKNSAELLLAKLEEKHTLNEAPKYFFPKSLSLTDKEEIINSYLDEDDINLNYVRLIENSKDSTDLKLSAKTRLKARKKSDELNNQIIENGYTWSIRYQIGISKDQIEPALFNNSDDLLEVIYSEKTLNSCLNSDIKLFHLFSQLFIYLDDFNLITLVSKMSETDPFERTFMKSKNSYETGEVFIRKENLSNLQLIIFEDYLRKNNNSIEQIINSFIEYLNNLIQPIKLIFKIHSNGSSFIEKIRNLAPDYEFLLKQYKLLVDDGDIDLELIQIDSNPIRFSELSSFNDKKYIYSNDNQILYLKYVFFSSQSFLHYIKPFEDKYNNLYDLLLNENVRIEDFKDYQKQEVEKLISENYLKINENGFIKLEKDIMILIIYEIHQNEVLNYWNYSKTMRDEIDILINNGLLKFENTLLTAQEKNYFNYYLNKKEFTNGYDLRNKYLHGTNSFSEDEHKMDYYRLLKIIILTLLKIEDDILIKTKK